MNDYQLPTPFEIASIAATLDGKMASKKPGDASLQALKLWVAARIVLDQAGQQQEAESLKKWREQHPAGGGGSKQITLKPDENGKSEAMEWINLHAQHDNDKFQTVRMFEKAWSAFEPMDLRAGKFCLSTTIEDLERFLLWRVNKRRTENTKGRAKKRADKRADKMPVEIPSTKISKIAVGQPAQSRSKKP